MLDDTRTRLLERIDQRADELRRHSRVAHRKAVGLALVLVVGAVGVAVAIGPGNPRPTRLRVGATSPVPSAPGSGALAWLPARLPPAPDAQATDGQPELTSVSCPTATFCVAVGRTAALNNLIETFDGSKWSLSPDLGTGGSGLEGVSCVSPTFCVAAGWNVMERFNGATWTSMSGVPTLDKPFFDSVSCVSTTFCLAAGTSTADMQHPDPILLEFDGSTWKNLPLGSQQSGAGAVSCVSPQFCAVILRGAIAMFDGSVLTVAVPGTPQSGFAYVSCPSASFCMALGQAVDQSTGRASALEETFDGHVWTAGPAPARARGFTSDNLEGLACTGPSFCVAPGQGTNPILSGSSASTVAEGPFIAIFDGASWTMAPADQMASAGEFHSVSCPSEQFCVATGDSDGPPPASQGFVQAWIGRRR